jgi:colanic acid/amylovoran biosynthesis glycosyltransferase
VKILMCADNFGGVTTTFIYNDFMYMSSKHDVQFLCTQRSNFRGINIHNVTEIGFKRGFIQRVLSKLDLLLSYRNKKYAKKLNYFVNELEPDVIHCNFGRESLKIIDNLENNNIPIVIQFRGYDASSALNMKSYVRRLKKVLSQKNIYPIFVSKSLRENLADKGIMFEKSDILYSGINLKKFIFCEKKKISGMKIFLQISSLVEKKGQEYTIQAFSLFLKNKNKDEYKLILTGDGPRKDSLELLSRSLGIEKNIEFIGNIDTNKAIELLSMADVFVHHSVTPRNGDQEGIPNALMEAMAIGLPVLSTKHSGIPELVADKENGFLVEEKDIESYAEKMDEIITWERLRKNRSVVEKNFEMTIHNKKLESIYNKVI